MKVQNNTMERYNKGGVKIKVVLALLIVLLGLGGYLYYWYSGVLDLQQRSMIAVDENTKLKTSVDRLEVLQNSLDAEYKRCQEFIIQSEGDFGSFEYCKRVINWINDNSLLSR